MESLWIWFLVLFQQRFVHSFAVLSLEIFVLHDVDVAFGVTLAIVAVVEPEVFCCVCFVVKITYFLPPTGFI